MKKNILSTVIASLMLIAVFASATASNGSYGASHSSKKESNFLCDDCTDISDFDVAGRTGRFIRSDVNSIIRASFNDNSHENSKNKNTNLRNILDSPTYLGT